MKPATAVPDDASAKPHAAFVTTRWSMVISAGRADTARAQEALAQLCKTYWYPLYAYVRQRGHSPDDAKDLTQEFFARLLERNTLRTITRGKGRFRSFLLASMNHFLTDEWRKARAEKRGGGRVLSIEETDAETRFDREPVDALTPEMVYERNWALALLERVYTALEQDYATTGKRELFNALNFCLTGDRNELPYAQLGEQLKMSEAAVKLSVHRLRQRYRELLREEVAQTVATPAEVEEELQHLFRALAAA